MICRDQEEASWLSSCLKEHLSLAESDLERAEFGEGIMVLPVEYTKGLEFDAVLLYDPSKEKYPWEDGYVKLLYVAATRALHELAVVHGENLTELIGKPVSREKHMKFLEGKTQKTEKNPEKKQDRDTDRIQKEGQPRREISSKIPALKRELQLEQEPQKKAERTEQKAQRFLEKSLRRSGRGYPSDPEGTKTSSRQSFSTALRRYSGYPGPKESDDTGKDTSQGTGDYRSKEKQSLADTKGSIWNSAADASGRDCDPGSVCQGK